MAKEGLEPGSSPHRNTVLALTVADTAQDPRAPVPGMAGIPPITSPDAHSTGDRTESCRTPGIPSRSRTAPCPKKAHRGWADAGSRLAEAAGRPRPLSQHGSSTKVAKAGPDNPCLQEPLEETSTLGSRTPHRSTILSIRICTTTTTPRQVLVLCNAGSEAPSVSRLVTGQVAHLFPWVSRSTIVSQVFSPTPASPPTHHQDNNRNQGQGHADQ